MSRFDNKDLVDSWINDWRVINWLKFIAAAMQWPKVLKKYLKLTLSLCSSGAMIYQTILYTKLYYILNYAIPNYASIY